MTLGNLTGNLSKVHIGMHKTSVYIPVSWTVFVCVCVCVCWDNKKTDFGFVQSCRQYVLASMHTG